jgi:hypothetical protein
MAFVSLRDKEPHFDNLELLWDAHRDKRKSREIFRLWEETIAPDAPQITLQQFISWDRTQRIKEKGQKKKMKERDLLPPKNSDIIRARRLISMVDMEQKVHQAADNLVDQALDASVSGKARDKAFSLTVVNALWGKLQKDKEIAIRAHAEKRETVGLFAKILRSAVSGEFTMADVQKLKNNYAGSNESSTTGIESGS